MEIGQDHEGLSLETPFEDHSLTLPSTLGSVEEVETAAEGLAQRAGFDEDDASNICMVIREAAINAVKHGNGFAPDKHISVRLRLSETAMTVSICDQGHGLDPQSLPDPLDPANLLRSSGRGVFLMRAMMDEVHFRQLSPGTEVTLIKHRYMEASR